MSMLVLGSGSKIQNIKKTNWITLRDRTTQKLKRIIRPLKMNVNYLIRNKQGGTTNRKRKTQDEKVIESQSVA